MASTFSKITRACCHLTNNLLQARHSNNKYCNQIRRELQDDKSSVSGSTWNRMYTAASQTRVFNFITPQQWQQQHRFFYVESQIVFYNPVASSSIQDMEEEERIERPLSELSTEELIDILHYLNLKYDENLSSNYSFAIQMLVDKAYTKFLRIENVGEISRVLQRLRELDLKGIVNYSVENAEGNADAESNLKQYLIVVSSMSLLPPGSVSFVSMNILAICTAKLLDRVSHLLSWQYRHPEFNLPWKKETMPIFVPSSPDHENTSAPKPKPKPLTPTEKESLDLAEKRLFDICAACRAVSLPLLVESEPMTNLQPAIDYLVYRAFFEFNKLPGKPVVYWGVQASRKDSLPRIRQVCQNAKKKGISIGVSLARGSLTENENPEAPYSEVDRCYDACASLMLNKVAAGEASLLLATHNFKSVKKAAVKAEELGIAKREGGLQFVQWKGIAESLSLALCKAGFDVSKYLPFGPADEENLSKRLAEHKGDMVSFKKIIGNHSDMELISKELIQRLKKVGVKVVTQKKTSFEIQFVQHQRAITHYQMEESYSQSHRGL